MSPIRCNIVFLLLSQKITRYSIVLMVMRMTTAQAPPCNSTQIAFAAPPKAIQFKMTLDYVLILTLLSKRQARLTRLGMGNVDILVRLQNQIKGMTIL